MISVYTCCTNVEHRSRGSGAEEKHKVNPAETKKILLKRQGKEKLPAESRATFWNKSTENKAGCLCSSMRKLYKVLEN